MSIESISTASTAVSMNTTTTTTTTSNSSNNDSDLLMKLKRMKNMKNADESVSYSLVNKQLLTNLLLFFGLTAAIYCVTIACNALNDQEELLLQKK